MVVVCISLFSDFLGCMLGWIYLICATACSLCFVQTVSRINDFSTILRLRHTTLWEDPAGMQPLMPCAPRERVFHKSLMFSVSGCQQCTLYGMFSVETVNFELTDLVNLLYLIGYKLPVFVQWKSYRRTVGNHQTALILSQNLW